MTEVTSYEDRILNDVGVDFLAKPILQVATGFRDNDLRNVAPVCRYPRF